MLANPRCLDPAYKGGGGGGDGSGAGSGQCEPFTEAEFTANLETLGLMQSAKIDNPVSRQSV